MENITIANDPISNMTAAMRNIKGVISNFTAAINTINTANTARIAEIR